jgi:hypothetical protein
VTAKAILNAFTPMSFASVTFMVRYILAAEPAVTIPTPLPAVALALSMNG